MAMTLANPKSFSPQRRRTSLLLHAWQRHKTKAKINQSSKQYSSTMAQVRIPLATFPGPAHLWRSDALDFFYSVDGKVVLPPNLFDVHGIKGNLSNLTKETEGGTKLSDAGEKWADDAYLLYPFLDSDQRDDLGRRYQKFPKTPENKLKFVELVLELFGSGSTSMFVDHIAKALQDEMVSRCTKDNAKLANGADPKTVDDVLSIMGSDDMIRKFNAGLASEVYSKILKWGKSLTTADSIDWLEKAVKQYLSDKNLQVVMAPGVSNTTERHSLLRWAVKKGTNAAKERVRKVESRAFGYVLDLATKVNKDAKDGSKTQQVYQERMSSPLYQVVLLDPGIVPASRQKYPAYWLKSIEVREASAQVAVDMCKAVAAGISASWSLPEMHALLDQKYQELKTFSASSPTPGQRPESSSAAPSPSPSSTPDQSPSPSADGSNGASTQQTSDGQGLAAKISAAIVSCLLLLHVAVASNLGSFSCLY